MAGKHPKRRKDKYNPYTINTIKVRIAEGEQWEKLSNRYFWEERKNTLLRNLNKNHNKILNLLCYTSFIKGEINLQDLS